MSSFYDIPPGHTVGSSLYTVFTHYSTPYLSEIADVANVSANNTSMADFSMDCYSFARFCKDMPDLMESSRNPNGINRRNLDLIFSKCTPIGNRRINFEHFLEALKLVAMATYPKEDPTNAFTKILVEHVFGAFDHNAVPPNPAIYEKILNELGGVSS